MSEPGAGRRRLPTPLQAAVGVRFHARPGDAPALANDSRSRREAFADTLEQMIDSQTDRAESAQQIVANQFGTHVEQAHLADHQDDRDHSRDAPRHASASSAKQEIAMMKIW